MKIFERILSRPEFQRKPPVLIDIGASGKVNPQWQSVSKFSVCIAFDADDRDFSYIEKETDQYKKLYIYNCIVSNETSDRSNFYLTKAPHCSSLLEPNQATVHDFAFSSKFDVAKVVQIKTVSLPKVLAELKIDYVDVFKTDAQGVDLRLFKSMNEEIIKRILLIEFEPGIYDAYKGEDKVFEVMEFMHQRGDSFWLSEMRPKGSQRITEGHLSEIFSNRILRTLAQLSMKSAPTYCEMVYLNKLSASGSFTIREILLQWILASIQEQHGFALHVSKKGYELFKDPIFFELERTSKQSLRAKVFKLNFISPVMQKLSIKNLQKFFNKSEEWIK